jgi:serine/threonine protein kinase
MAEVWLAENKIGKKAAVKILLSKYCDDDNVTSRFSTEAKVMVELNHPNIRQVYDYGEIDGTPCIIMEYLEGDDLKAKIKRGQHFPDSELTKWWNQLVSALTYTHKQGVVHRDIKPGNIFVDTNGNIKLLDFGIAKVRDSISSTQTGQKIGTLMYMSPEQVKDSKHIDYRTDVYSLAVTFVHLITGKKPYDSDTTSDFEISNKIVYSPLDLSEVPSHWRDLLTPYLTKEADKRPDLKPIADKNQAAAPSASSDDETIVDRGNGSVPPKKPIVKDNADVGAESAGTTPPQDGKNKVIVFLATLLIIGLGVLLVVNHGRDKCVEEEDTVPIDSTEMVEEYKTAPSSAQVHKSQIETKDVESERNVQKSQAETRDVVSERNQQAKEVSVKTHGYVDLGLPSGTLWKDKNEGGGFYTYDEAVSKFGDRLPTKAQFEELNSKCQWSWTGSGYKVTGPNGNSIVLPAAGYRHCGGSVYYYVGSRGYYWSSSPDGSDDAWYLDFDSGEVGMYNYDRCLGSSVRLVQD